MFELISIEKIEIEKIKTNLWMNEADLRELTLNGHKIGYILLVTQRACLT